MDKTDKTVTVKGQKYILASSLLAEERIRVLKHQETFAIFDRYGDISGESNSEEGIFFDGTRFLSHLEFSLGVFRPLLLSSNLRIDNQLFAVDLTNPDFYTADQKLVPRGSVYITRRIFIQENSVYEKVMVMSFYQASKIPLTLSYTYDGDFKGIFEVRGYQRKRSGRKENLRWEKGQAVISYLGLDEVQRQTQISFQPQPQHCEGNTASYSLELDPREPLQIEICYDFLTSEDKWKPSSASPRERYEFAQHEIEDEVNHFRLGNCDIDSSNEQFNDMIKRSFSDIHMLNSRTPYGIYPYAGVPWFSTTFGRDGLITALQMVWINPQIARGVLDFLAHRQARDLRPERDAEPGKILHEARRGEMAKLGEIPFSEYYGSVDSTPLFLILAGEYFRTTGDLAFIHSIWENIRMALRWIDEYGDRDKDGFVEYERLSKDGLTNQGWKDSHDSIFHSDEVSAPTPIALCEVQGYVYQAKDLIAQVAQALGQRELANKLHDEATILKDRFHQQFWCEDLNTYALALDGNKELCRVVASNPGHCLYSGIVNQSVADRLIDTLTNTRMFSGWGIRTLAEGEPRYNPMSYHNGSIWPHDNSLIAMGLARYGRKDAACRILNGLYEASLFMDLNRLPELFCGFRQRSGEGPTLYPLSCAPQAWAAASIFMVLQACLGLKLNAVENRIVFESPLLPDFLKVLRLSNLRLGAQSSVDLEIVRHGYDVGINILRRSGPVKIIVQK